MSAQSNGGQRKMARRLMATVHGYHGAAPKLRLKRRERERLRAILGEEPKLKPPSKSVARALKKRVKTRESKAWKGELD